MKSIKNLVAYGQFGNQRQRLPRESKINTQDLDDATVEGITIQLQDKFNSGIFPAPSELSDREITVISQWGGLDSDGTFGVHRGEKPDLRYQEQDYRIIEEYKLDASAGENTRPKFAAMLKSKKEAWAQDHPKEAARLRGKEALEGAVERCAVAGMTEEEIMTETQQWCNEICE